MGTQDAEEFRAHRELSECSKFPSSYVSGKILINPKYFSLKISLPHFTMMSYLAEMIHGSIKFCKVMMNIQVQGKCIDFNWRHLLPIQMKAISLINCSGLRVVQTKCKVVIIVGSLVVHVEQNFLHLYPKNTCS